MEKEIKENEKEKDDSSSHWKNFAQLFLTNLASRISGSVSDKISEWMEKIKKKAASAIMMAVGAIFFLVGAAIYINTLVDNSSQWAGYIIVGGTIFIIGYLFSRD